jgi:glycosyltransferase involved in cell wall biosynthesis
MPKEMPTVSVVMGVYNGEQYLRQAVESILGQTYPHFEFLIVNDGSTDGVAGILARFSDPRIRIITNQGNEGLTKSLIRGCGEARGKYIARMDADDISHPQRLEKEVAFLDAHPDHGVVGCCYSAIDPDGCVIKWVRYPLRHDEIVRFMLTSNVFVHGATLFRPEVYHQVGGYREFFQHAQDYDLWLRVSEQAKLGNLPESLYQHRHHHHKIAFRNIYSQRLFAHLAKRLAEVRRASGVDPLAEENYAAVNRLLDEVRPKGLLKRQAMISQYYCDIARDYEKLKMKDLSRLLIASFIRNPLNRALWKFLLSSKFRGRVQSGLRRRLSVR